MYANVYSSIIHRRQKVETTKMSINWWIDKQMWYTQIIEYFDHKKEWSTDTYQNMDGPWKHYEKWKKSITKDHVLYDSYEMSRM